MQLLFDDFEGVLRTLLVGVVAYVALVVVLRSSGKRTLSKMNAFDLVVTVALGSTLATILLSHDTPLAEGVVAFLVLAGMQRLITEASLRSRTVARLVKSEPRALVYRGAVLHDALHEERVLEEELQAAMRAQGLARYEDADLVVLETDGSFTAVPHLPDGPSAATDALRSLPTSELVEPAVVAAGVTAEAALEGAGSRAIARAGDRWSELCCSPPAGKGDESSNRAGWNREGSPGGLWGRGRIASEVRGSATRSAHTSWPGSSTTRGVS